jgi:hypothetical protein
VNRSGVSEERLILRQECAKGCVNSEYRRFEAERGNRATGTGADTKKKFLRDAINMTSNDACPDGNS